MMAERFVKVIFLGYFLRLGWYRWGDGSLNIRFLGSCALSGSSAPGSVPGVVRPGGRGTMDIEEVRDD